MRLPELQDDDKEAKKLSSKRLPEGWKDIELPRPFVRSESHPLRADKQASRRSLCRPLWHRKDLGADSQKILLADATTRR